ncbi:sulfotransferase family protein [Thiorhodococcus fuscus]|uniref:Sulfotransferase family protein n=1 Tax=Thiorhodococcus fuscus TaxID=527200 RepID=A0ABW4YC37_9GAMM
MSTIALENAPIILGGFYRSGTTLLRRLLDAHPAVHCPSELKFFRDVLGEYADDPYGHLRFFNACRVLPLSETERIALLGRAYVSLREASAQRLGKRRWADKEPENARYLPQWEQVLGEGFVYVHVLREPLDVFASLREMRFEKSLSPVLANQLGQYRLNGEAALHFAAKAPERFYCLHYESIAEQPKAIMKELLAWLGLEPDRSLLDAFNAPERGRGLEDPKIDKTHDIHAESIGRGGRELDMEIQNAIRREVGALYSALSDFARPTAPLSPSPFPHGERGSKDNRP